MKTVEAAVNEAIYVKTDVYDQDSCDAMAKAVAAVEKLIKLQKVYLILSGHSTDQE